MSEPRRCGPLDDVARPSGATVTLLPPCVRFVLRGREAAVLRAGEVLGLALPQTACRSESSRDLAALWLGPDEWLLLADDAQLFTQLTAALAGLPHALVDVSHRQAGLEISGPGSAVLLNAGCPLDLDRREFPVGACTRSVLGKTEIVLWRTGDTRFRLEVSRSFAEYAWLLLQEAREV